MVFLEYLHLEEKPQFKKILLLSQLTNNLVPISQNLEILKIRVFLIFQLIFFSIYTLLNKLKKYMLYVKP